MFARYLLSGILLFTLVGASARSEDDPRTAAINKGVKYLKDLYKKNPTNEDANYKFGKAALRGLAMLESGVPTSDPAIQSITDYIRNYAVSQTKTYEIALGIMYLDRLGDRFDQPAIQFLAVQLLAHQGATGLWSYDGGVELKEAEAARMRRALYDDSRLRSPNAKDPPAKAKTSLAESTALHPEVLRFARANGAFADLSMRGGGQDHSNTQFAVLALWIARKHGAPVNAALLAAEKNYRTIQKRDGGWDYQGSDRDDTFLENRSTPPMTCTGLVALAVGRGLGLQALRSKFKGGPKGTEIADATTDRQAQAALKYIENAIVKSERDMEGGNLRDNLYFLWSLERVGVIYDLEKIGTIEWYKWGADYLIKTQSENGSWGGGGYEGANSEINTAFALLFLNRANLAKDLTATLKGTAKINLPERKTDPEPIKVNPKQSGDPEAEATRLANELIKATATTRPTTLAKLRDTKGSVYTEALVRAIAKLQGEPQREAREALALRLKRMTALTLREMLKDENPEIRNAAAWACGLKDDKQFISDLIVVLNDTETLVVQSARNSLRSLSGKDFGPQSDANPADKAKAIADWKAWLAAQPK